MNFEPTSELISLIYIEMNYSYDIWDISASEHSLGSVNLFYQPDSPNQRQDSHLHQLGHKTDTPEIEPHLLVGNAQVASDAPSKGFLVSKKGRSLNNRTNTNVPSYGQQKSKRRKKIKPSPYHNYQKHLNTTLKHLLTFPSIDSNAPISVHIAFQLWSTFLQSQSSTKKVLHFIFNQFNEYRIKDDELRQFGFEEIYSKCAKEVLGEAKTYLTNLVISQMKEENIESYLETRRIKNPLKFKRYLLVFRKQLQDGFLKKRFTNRNRKEQMRREFTINSQ